MLDQADQDVARQLAERHLYPYARDIYQSVFKRFSHFPIGLKDINIKAAGKTITVMAWAVRVSFQTQHANFNELFERVYAGLKEKIPPYFPQDPVIDILIGCILYYYHPSHVRNALSMLPIDKMLDSHQRYEFQLKKGTLYIHVI
jgi:hypothetical protein